MQAAYFRQVSEEVRIQHLRAICGLQDTEGSTNIILKVPASEGVHTFLRELSGIGDKGSFARSTHLRCAEGQLLPGQSLRGAHSTPRSCSLTPGKELIQVIMFATV